ADVTTRHVPVCVISTEESRRRAFREGALGFIAKPIQSRDVLDVGIKGLLDGIRRDKKRVVIAAAVDAPARDIADAIASENIEIEIVH
ncbi:hypothetical protein, partial [Vibrio parahaemolyticus]|uniref:hypothetical protein n=1 Tax=Vibrio parahaemolyticus TaxID=670 RepID=UPI001A8C8FCC